MMFLQTFMTTLIINDKNKNWKYSMALMTLYFYSEQLKMSTLEADYFEHYISGGEH